MLSTRVPFLEVSKSGADFRLSKKPLSSIKKCELKIVFSYDIVMILQSSLCHSPAGGDQLCQALYLYS